MTPTVATTTPVTTPLVKPERPRFYAGQLLTDVDLEAIVEWARAKRRLDALALGWGVVDGLAVRADPTNSARVIVGPGYAIGPGGDDIVVESDTPLDLSKKVRPKPSPCVKKPATTAPDLFGFPADEVTTLDLAIDPAEVQADPRRPSGNATLPPQYARVAEGSCLSVADAADPADPVAAFTSRLSAWKTAAAALVDALIKGPKPAPPAAAGAVAATPPPPPTDDQVKPIRDAFAAWLKAYPPTRSPYLVDRLQGMSNADLIDKGKLADLAYGLVNDARAALLAPGVPDFGDLGPGVPLARVWLREVVDPTTGRRSPKLIAVDDAPPRRRPIAGPDPWPAPDGSTNLARWLGLRTDPKGLTLVATLEGLGLVVTGVVTTPITLDHLKSLVAADPIQARGARFDVQLIGIDDLSLGPRFAGIVPT